VAARRQLRSDAVRCQDRTCSECSAIEKAADHLADQLPMAGLLLDPGDQARYGGGGDREEEDDDGGPAGPERDGAGPDPASVGQSAV